MSLALAAYDHRIASVFDSANHLVVWRDEPPEAGKSVSLELHPEAPGMLFRLLVENHIRVLICGAIRGCALHQLENAGIHVISWVTGDIDRVVAAYRDGSLNSAEFIMPGCHKPGHHGGRGAHGRRRAK